MGKVTELRIGGPRGGADRGGSGEGCKTVNPAVSELHGLVSPPLHDPAPPPADFFRIGYPAANDARFVRLERAREADDLTLPWWFTAALMAGVWIGVLSVMAGLVFAVILLVEIAAYLTGAW